MVSRVIDIRRDIAAPRSIVWALLADSAGYASWGFWDEATLERPGPTDRDGVGAIRILASHGRVLREQITDFVPGERMSYRLVSGLPVRSYSATVSLTPRPGGTTLTWRCTIEAAPVVAGLVRRRLRPFIAEAAAMLAARAEHDAGTVVFAPPVVRHGLHLHGLPTIRSIGRVGS